MDEVAREAILEAMQQNNIRPFENAREEMEIKEISIPPRKSKKKKGGKKKKGSAIIEAEEEAAPAWLTFDTMKEALKAGWEVRLFRSYLVVLHPRIISFLLCQNHFELCFNLLAG